MKFIYLFILFGCFALNLNSKPVDAVTAKQAAFTYYQGTNKTSSLQSAEDIILLTNSKNIFNEAQDINLNYPSFYIFTSKDSIGFVIVSGDDIAQPIIAYSFENMFADDVPANVKGWLKYYDYEIKNAVNAGVPQSQEIAEKWNNFRSGKKENTLQEVIVAPLIKTKWDQGEPYNMYCPYDNFYGERAVTGCVATSMAQIMKFWNHPYQGVGTHSYFHTKYGSQTAMFASAIFDWDNMTNTYSSSSNLNSKRAVAQLMYHCGVALEMDYGVKESGAYSRRIATGLQDFFLYDKTAQWIEKKNYNSNEWINMLKKELNEGRPMEYSGFDAEYTSGHSFVCDGYESDNYFHFNFGWGGLSDGFYSLSHIVATEAGAGAGTHNFTYYQAAVIGIKPLQGLSAKLTISKEFVLDQPAVWVNGKVKVRANFLNESMETFNGTAGMALFNEDGTFNRILDTEPISNLPPNYTFTNSIVFESDNLFGTKPGVYYIHAVYVPNNSNQWMYVKDGATVKNLLQIQIGQCYYQGTVRLHSEPEINPLIVYQNSSLEVKASFYNEGPETFDGYFSADIYTLSGQYVKQIGYISTSEPLLQGYYYVNPLKFTGNTNDLEPGEYYFSFSTKNGDQDWTIVNSGNFTLFKKFTVIKPPVAQDSYEPNNSLAASSDISPVWLSYQKSKTFTIDATLHEGDTDFYKIVLPEGFNYSLTSEALDKYSSELYTVDIQYSLRYSTGDWSDFYDFDQAEPIQYKNGGTVYIKVNPYLIGSTGTYGMKFIFTRESTADAANDDEFTQWQPVIKDNKITLNTEEIQSFSAFNVYDVKGSKLISLTNAEAGFIDISSLVSGVYFIEAVSGSQTLKYKFIK